MQPEEYGDLSSRLAEALIDDAHQRAQRPRFRGYAEGPVGEQQLEPLVEPQVTAGSEIFGGETYATLRSLVPDVEASVDRFVHQNRLLADLGIPSPAARIGDGYAPIDLGLGGFHDTTDRRTVEGLVAGLLQRPETTHPQALRISATPPAAAESYVRRHLPTFLKLRLFSDNRMDEPAGPPNGFVFEVHTGTPNLRIHYSPAYFFEPRVTFGFTLGDPPLARAILQPGRYVFGAFLPNPGFWTEETYDVPHLAYADLRI